MSESTQPRTCSWCGAAAVWALTRVTLDLEGSPKVAVTDWCDEHLETAERGARSHKAAGYGGAWKAVRLPKA